MEDMDIDVVPDTPDRYSTQKSNAGGEDVVEVHSSNSRRSVHNSVRSYDRLGIENRRSRLFSHHRGGVSSPNKAVQNMPPEFMVLDSPPSSMKACSFRRRVDEQGSPQPQPLEHVPSRNDRAKLDGSTAAVAEMLTSDDRFQGRNKEKVDGLISCQKMPSNGWCHSGRGDMRKKIGTQGNTSSAVEEGARNRFHVDLGFGKAIHLPGDAKQKATQDMSTFQQSIPVPRKNGQRKLVRNGCISPHNIAKAKHTAEGDVKDDHIQEAIPNSRIPMSEGNHTGRMNGVKGKGVVGELCPAQEYNANTSQSSSRGPLNPTEEATTAGDVVGVSCEGIDGWRSTRNRSKKTSLALPDDVEHLSRRSSGFSHLLDTGNPVSFQPELTQSTGQGSSSIMSELVRGNLLYSTAHNEVKRQRKFVPASSHLGGCSTSNLDNSEAAFARPSKGPSNARSTTSRNNHGSQSSGVVIEIDEQSPVVRPRSLHSTSQTVDDDADVRARQVEADEMLARELQEQLYSEWSGVGSGEIDASLARTLQQEENRRTSSVGRSHVHPRDSSMSHFYQHQLHNAVARSTTRANRGRASSSSRTRLRERFPGPSSTISNSRIDFRFPPNMDVEMRLQMLEALEAAAGDNNNMANLYQVHRDFNENDYEMLLALDERNDGHGGASTNQINGLPQSTVQTENFDEACAICLDTPTIGDTIRHLPCLHKFHKECIDPWLRRKTSCPICKSSIT